MDVNKKPEAGGHIGEAFHGVADVPARLHASLYACVLHTFLSRIITNQFTTFALYYKHWMNDNV